MLVVLTSASHLLLMGWLLVLIGVSLVESGTQVLVEEAGVNGGGG